MWKSCFLFCSSWVQTRVQSLSLRLFVSFLPLQENSVTVGLPHIRPRNLPSPFLAVRYSQIVLQFDAVFSDLITASLNKSHCFIRITHVIWLTTWFPVMYALSPKKQFSIENAVLSIVTHWCRKCWLVAIIIDCYRLLPMVKCFGGRKLNYCSSPPYDLYFWVTNWRKQDCGAATSVHSPTR